MKKLISFCLALLLCFSFAFSVLAESNISGSAYANIITASDFQTTDWYEAYNRFGKMLSHAKEDGLTTPDGVLIGGDYTVVLLDDAVTGMWNIRDKVMTAFPDFNTATLVATQGNHDNPNDKLTKTGFYDMGYYCVYAINEDDFPWKQNKSLKAEGTVKATAEDLANALDTMIANEDYRPVFIVTHVPLHHTYRSGGGDNMYAGYLLDVISKAAETLDIVFLFGHNHSSPYDDYIGGAVNYMAPGETIRLADVNNVSEDAYVEKTLNFVYTNCGYAGYSGNSDNETSTSTLTMDVIQLEKTEFRFVRYSEDGFYSVKTYARKNVVSDEDVALMAEKVPVYGEDSCLCHNESAFVQLIWKVFSLFLKLFNFGRYCECGEAHW